jgi:hypothetical protein
MKARIGAALSLAIGNRSAQAVRTLAEIEPSLDPGDSEIAARYFQARAIANIKARAISEASKRSTLRYRPRDDTASPSCR